MGSISGGAGPSGLSVLPGRVLTLHGFLYAVTPWLWMAREASRFMYLTDFGIAILAGFGLDALFSQARLSSWDPLSGVLKWIAIACNGSRFSPA